MELGLDNLKVSWTKYDVVQTFDLLFDKETFLTLISPPMLNSSVLQAFLGTQSLNERNIPEYWFEILRYPLEKKIFGLFSLILTHHDIIKIFQKSSNGDMTGSLNLESHSAKGIGRKVLTNLRSCLIESGASHVMHRRKEVVPYDFSIIFNNDNIGPIFRKLLIDRLNRIVIGKEVVNIDNYYSLIEEYELYKCFSYDVQKFKKWLENDLLKAQKLNESLPHIKRVTIDNFYSITEMDLDFKNSQEIYFIGENGDGKTLILMAIYLAFNKTLIEEKFDQELTGKIKDILRENPRCKLEGYNNINNKASYGLENIFAYGTHRGRYSSEYYERYGFMSLFDINQELISPEKWMKDYIIQHRYSTDEYSNIDYIKEVLYELLDRKVNIQIEGSELVFSEKGRDIKFDQLSEGFRSIIIFIIDLLYRLQKISGGNPDIFSTSAVVIVDEIDLHLHPKWKKNIVPKLRNIFKNIQFIFSTHSPTIIQGASEDAVLYKVVRNKNGITNITEKYFRKDLNHMMLNTLITSPLFDLETAKLDSSIKDYDTSDDYLFSRIHKQVQRKLNAEKKSSQKAYLSEQEIDDLIQNILSEYND